jgi:hypothetical protein
MPPEPVSTASEPTTPTSPSRTQSASVAEGGAAWGRPPWAANSSSEALRGAPHLGTGGGSFIRSRPSDPAHDDFVRAHGIDRDSILTRANAAAAAASAVQGSPGGAGEVGGWVRGCTYSVPALRYLSQDVHIEGDSFGPNLHLKRTGLYVSPAFHNNCRLPYTST